MQKINLFKLDIYMPQNKRERERVRVRERERDDPLCDSRAKSQQLDFAPMVSSISRCIRQTNKQQPL